MRSSLQANLPAKAGLRPFREAGVVRRDLHGFPLLRGWAVLMNPSEVFAKKSRGGGTRRRPPRSLGSARSSCPPARARCCPAPALPARGFFCVFAPAFENYLISPELSRERGTISCSPSFNNSARCFLPPSPSALLALRGSVLRGAFFARAGSFSPASRSFLRHAARLVGDGGRHPRRIATEQPHGQARALRDDFVR